MLVLVVDGVAQRNSRRRFVARVGVGHRPCNDINIACIGVAVKSNLQRAARVGVGADDRGAYADVAALEVHARRARPRKTKHVLRVGVPVPANGQHRPAPVGIEVKFGVDQIDVGVKGDRCVLGVPAICKADDRRCIIHVCRYELETAGRRQITAVTTDIDPAIAEVVDGHGEVHRSIAIDKAGCEGHVVARGGNHRFNSGHRSRQRNSACPISCHRRQSGRCSECKRTRINSQSYGVLIRA